MSTEAIKKIHSLLTIVMPVYQRETYFLSALESVLAQTVECEIIVADNNSSTAFFASECASRGIKYVKFATHVSMFENWNRAMALADTEYVMILGDDDLLEKEYVESFYKTLAEYGRIDLYYTDVVLITADGSAKEKGQDEFRVPFGYQVDGSKIIEYGARYGLGFPTVSCVYKKESFSGFYHEFHASNDWLYIYKNIRRLRLYGCRQAKLSYRKHSGADTSNPETKVREFLSHAYIYMECILPYLDDKDLKKMVEKKAAHCLLSLRFVAHELQINTIADLDNIYSSFLKKRLEKSALLRLLFKLPPWLVLLAVKTKKWMK